MSHALVHFFSDNADALKSASYVLAALSFLFGTKILGRFPQLSRRGGFYSSILVAVPTGVLTAALYYALDVSTHRGYTQILSDAFSIPVSSFYFAIATGVLFGALTSLIVPEAQRSWLWEQFRALQAEDFRQYEGWGCGHLLLLNIYVLIVRYVSSLIATAFLLTGLARWSNGLLVPPVPVSVVILGVPALISGLRALGVVRDLASVIAEEMQASVEKEEPDPSPVEENESQRQQATNTLEGALSASKTSSSVSLWILLLSLAGILADLLGTLLSFLIRSVGDIAVVIYYAVRYGLTVPFYWAIGGVGLYVSMRGLRELGDRLSTRMLTLVFGLLGLVASLIQILLDYPQLFKLLPF